MKKNVFAAFLLVLTAMAFVACGTQNDPNALTGIAVTPASVSLVPGDELRLSVTPTPSAAVVNPDSVVWVSTDTSVVVVNANGVITAVGYGAANVEATYGEFKSACAVKVLTYFETLQFTSAFLLDVDTLGLDSTLTVHEITTSDGSETYNCYMSLATLWLFSDGFYVNDDGMLDGAEKGTVIEVQAPVYYGTLALNPEKERGALFTLGTWGVDARDTLANHVGAPGEVLIEPYTYYMDFAVQAMNANDINTFAAALQYAGMCFAGTTFSTYEYSYDAEKQEGGYMYGYIPDGVVTKGQFEVTQEGAPSGLMYGLTYSYFELLTLKNEVVSENSEYAYGCLFEYSEEGVAWNDKKIAFDDPVVSTFGELPSAEVQKMEPVYLPVIKIDYPEAAERLEKQLIKNNSLIRFKK